MEVLLPQLHYGHGQSTLPNLVAEAVGPILFEAAACWPNGTSDMRARCCSGGDVGCFTRLYTHERCCWEHGSTWGLQRLPGASAEPLQPSSVPEWPELNDDVLLVNRLQEDPRGARLLPRRPLASCVLQGSGLLLSWLQFVGRCSELLCLPPVPSLDISVLCRPLLALSMMDAYTDLWNIQSGRAPAGLSEVLQRHNTHLWQVAAAGLQAASRTQ